MKICPNCNTQNVFDGAQFCRECGASLENTGSVQQGGQNSPPVDNDFVVTESANPSSLELSATEEKQAIPRQTEDDLEIKPNACLLEDEALVVPHREEKSHGVTPIGESAPPPPPIADAIAGSKAVEKTEAEDKEKIKRLSKEELANITKNLYNSSTVNRGLLLGERQANGLRGPEKHPTHSAPVDSVPEMPPLSSGGVRPIEDPALAAEAPKTHKTRGVAYFTKNFIQVIGSPYIHSGDELALNDKLYVLRPKKFSKKVTIGAFAAVLAIILFIVGSQFIGPTVSGSGDLIGLVLNQNGQPYLEGARVTIPALDKTTKTNAQGFFKFELVPTGTYELSFELKDNMAGSANATVTDGQTTLITCGNAARGVNAGAEPQRQSYQGAYSAGDSPARSKAPARNAAQDRAYPGFGSIRLAANVDGARLSIDNKVVGSGNNTYARITPGNHRIAVSKPGYSEYSAVVNVEPDHTSTVEVNLNSLTLSSAINTSAEDHLARGNVAFNKNNYQNAIEEYSKAIALSPGLKEAYSKRGEAYGRIGNSDKAAADYIRLGEIYRVAKSNSKAISAFTAALSFDSQNKIALAGRAGVRLDNAEYRPALLDYEDALKSDDRFYPALFGAGICQFRLGNNKQADKYYRNAYKVNPADPMLYQYMMLNLLALDDIKRMRQIYAEFRVMATPSQLAEFRSSSRFAPVVRLIDESDR